MFENGVNGQLYKKYPDILFEQATGTQIKKNQSEYFGAGEDTIYLSGMAAGAASKKGKIGYIVPFGIPEVVRHINAFTLGAQVTHPGATVRLLWTNSWYSPQKEAAAAKALIAAGVDVLGQNVDTPQAGVVAEAKGVPWVGYDSDARTSAPKQWLTAATYNWGLYYVKRVKAAINGKLEVRASTTARSRTASRDSLRTARRSRRRRRRRSPRRERPSSRASSTSSRARSYDQKGKVVVPAGKTLKVLPDLYSMQWLAKGVIGKVSTVAPPG